MMMRIAFFFTLSVFSVTSFAQINNPGFEIWEVDTLFQEPESYLSSNFFSYLSSGAPNVTPVSGVSGLAVRLETVVAGSDTLPGAIYNSDEFTSLAGGFPYNGIPDSLIIDLRYSIPSGDTAMILMFFKSGGLVINPNVFPITGSQPVFQQFRFNIGPQFVSSDTVFIAMFSTNVDQPAAGGWMEVDNMNIIGTASQTPNSSFDNWTTLSSEEPVGWFSTNLLNLIDGTAPAVTKTSDSHSGSYAVRIETFTTFIDSDVDTMGFITNGRFGEEGLVGGSPISFKPNRLEGWYKNAVTGSDSSVIALSFTEYNIVTGSLDSLAGFTFAFSPSGSYVPFSFSFDISSLPQPDTFLIAVAASNLITNRGVSIGSNIHVDDLALVFVSGSEDHTLERRLTIGPNPGSEYITFKIETDELVEIEVFNVNGSSINRSSFSSQYTMDLSDLAGGTYYYQLRFRNGAQVQSGQFIVQH